MIDCRRKATRLTGPSLTGNARLATGRQAVREDALETVFVDYRRHRFFAFFFQGAHHASGAIHLHIGVSAQHGGRQHDAEADHGANVKRAFGVEEDATGGDVSGFGKVFVGVRRTDRDGKPEGKTY